MLFSCLVMSDCLWTYGLQQARLTCPSLSPRVCSDSCLLSWWCYPNHLILCCPLLLPSVFPRSGSFLLSQLFPWGSQSIGASASVLAMKGQHWFLLGLTGLILLSKGLFKGPRIWKHQCSGARSSLWLTLISVQDENP